MLASARQALAYATGEADPSPYGVHVPATIDVRAIRHKIGLSQEDFAQHFGVNKRTVQEWEQGRRQPSGPARTLLVVIDREPEAVYRALCA
jgi:putative transcriptional regulator